MKIKLKKLNKTVTINRSNHFKITNNNYNKNENYKINDKINKTYTTDMNGNDFLLPLLLLLILILIPIIINNNDLKKLNTAILKFNSA